MLHNSNNAIENANSHPLSHNTHTQLKVAYWLLLLLLLVAVNIHFVPFHFPCTSSTSMNLMKNPGPMYYISRTENMHIKQECCVCILFLCINNKIQDRGTTTAARGAHTKFGFKKLFLLKC